MNPDPVGTDVGETVEPVDNHTKPELPVDAANPRIPQGFHK